MASLDPTISALRRWQADPDPARFPYDAVLAELHRVGKHFAAAALLDELETVRGLLPRARGCPRRLAGFLQTALDKRDGRYDNPSYLALDALALPGSDGADSSDAARRCDRLSALLLADVIRFELDALEGRTAILPELRPDPRTVGKRCGHAVRAIRPALERLGVGAAAASGCPLSTARRAADAVLATATEDERLMLRTTVLPVYVTHDEYMFIRGLQLYETRFALIGVQLRSAIACLGKGDAAGAVGSIRSAESSLRESSPLWSFVATMQHEAFLRFREYTDGASAIQSRNYKLIESLCRTPQQARLEGAAFAQVPEVREQIVAGQPNIDGTLSEALAAGLLDGPAHARVHEAMQGFEAAIFKWRQTHYRIAVRMLGDRRGTGGSEGQEYLAAARAVPVFTSRCPAGHGSRVHRVPSTTTGRCPAGFGGPVELAGLEPAASALQRRRSSN